MKCRSDKRNVASSSLPRGTSHAFPFSYHPKLALQARSSLTVQQRAGVTSTYHLRRILTQGDGVLAGSDLSIFVKIQVERLNVLLETESAHGPQQIVTIYRFPFLPLALVTRPAWEHSAYYEM